MSLLEPQVSVLYQWTVNELPGVLQRVSPDETIDSTERMSSKEKQPVQTEDFQNLSQNCCTVIIYIQYSDIFYPKTVVMLMRGAKTTHLIYNEVC